MPGADQLQLLRRLLAPVLFGATLLGACRAAAPLPRPATVAKVAARVDPSPVDAELDAGAPTGEPASDARFAALDAPIEEAIREGKLPGCVVVVGHADEILFQKAYGLRASVPAPEPMTVDTIFDLASLTKPIATTTSVMLLADEGRLDLDKPASTWLPELGDRGRFSLRQLLVHTSGLPAVTPLAQYTPDRRKLLTSLAALRRDATPPGTKFVYSDVGFVLLEEIVRRASGEDFATFTRARIFEPLGMKDAQFLPPEDVRARIAPTETRAGNVMRGEVHDPRAFALGGVAGNAGLFATADDVARFAQAMLGRGARAGHRVVAEKTFDRFLTRHETSKGPRALGWDLESAYATHRSPRLSARAFGHGGFTGTAVWIDPDRDFFFVFLSNRVHPDGKGAVNPLVKELATRAVDALDVQAGVDVLAEQGFAALAGKKVGLLTNDAARTRGGERTLDALRRGGVDLRVVFTPEHGLGGDREGHVDDARIEDLPVRSLYGGRYAPGEADLAGIDTLVVDLKDVGVRFYTYASTLKRTMKAIASSGSRVNVVVLDRPNPLGGERVEGPVLETSTPDGGATLSFVNHHALPVVHGMTLGELAGLFAADDDLAVKLEVVRARGWRRKDTLDRTGLPWTNPSPNLRSLRAAILYPAVGLLEGTNVSVGRGTDTPFEVLGAPWLDRDAFVQALLAEHLPGTRVEPVTFEPTASVHAGKVCQGARFVVEDREAYAPVRVALGIARALRATAAGSWRPEGFLRMLGHAAAARAFEAGERPESIEATWTSELERFEARRRPALLYP